MTLSKKGQENFDKYKKDFAGSRKVLGMLARTVVSAPGQVIDIGLLPYNVVQALRGKEGLSLGEKSKALVDKATSNAGKPETGGERIGEALLDATMPGGIVMKGLKLLMNAGKIASATKAAKVADVLLKPTIASTVGAGASQSVLNENPNNPIAALAASIASASGTKTAVKGAQKAFVEYPKHLMRRHDLNRLSQNPNLYENVKKEIGKSMGDKDLSSKSHENAGKDAISGFEREKIKSEARFGEDFSKRDSYIKQHHPNARIDVTDEVKWLTEALGELESTESIKNFLKRPAGQKLLQLTGLSSKEANKDINRTITVLKDLGKRKHSMSYADTQDFLADISNTTSMKDIMGSRDIGELRKIKGGVKAKVLDLFSKDPEMHSFVDNLNKDYAVHKKKFATDYNDVVVPNAPFHTDPGEPTAAFRALMNGEDNILQNPNRFKRAISGMTPEEKNNFALSVINDTGRKKGKFDPTQSVNNLRDLQDPVYETLMESLDPKVRTQFEGKFPLVDKLEFEQKQPMRESYVGKYMKKLPFIPPAINRFARTDPKTVNKVIDALDYQVAKDAKYATPKPTLLESGKSLVRKGSESILKQAVNTERQSLKEPLEELNTQEHILQRIAELEAKKPMNIKNNIDSEPEPSHLDSMKARIAELEAKRPAPVPLKWDEKGTPYR